MKRRCLLILVALAVAATLSAGLGTSTAAATPPARPAVIGGGLANPSKWPFAVAIFRKGRLHCGGSVISATQVLTAAHCVLGFSLGNFAVVANRFNLRNRSVGAVIRVASARIHPDYEPTGFHDIAVLNLGQPTTVAPVALPTAAEDATSTVPGAVLRVAGWGARNPLGRSLSSLLKRATEKVRSPRRCLRAYTRDIFDPALMICTLGRRIRAIRRPPIHAGACTGDSGGPLVADSPAGPRVVGLVSFGGPICGLAAAPTVYTRIAASLDFITAG